MVLVHEVGNMFRSSSLDQSLLVWLQVNVSLEVFFLSYFCGFRQLAFSGLRITYSTEHSGMHYINCITFFIPKKNIRAAFFFHWAFLNASARILRQQSNKEWGIQIPTNMANNSTSFSQFKHRLAIIQHGYVRRIYSEDIFCHVFSKMLKMKTANFIFNIIQHLYRILVI